MNKKPEKALEEHDLAASFNQNLLLFYTILNFWDFYLFHSKFAFNPYALKNG